MSSVEQAQSLSWIEVQIVAAEGDAALLAHLTRLKDFFQTKRWHQLTTELEELLKLPQWTEGDFLIQLYHNFIKSFQSKANPLKLAQIGLKITAQFRDAEQAISFLNSLSKEVEGNQQAQVLLQCNVGSILLEQRKIAEVKPILENARETLDTVVGVDPSVNASYYILSATYHKLLENAADFYKDMLLYLAYVSGESIPVERQQDIARDLSISALVGETVFAFGELISHPVFETLRNSSNSWIADVVKAFNVGDIDTYKKLVAQNQQAFQAMDVFVNKSQFLIEKITILALMENVFRSGSERRVFTFAQVAGITQLPENEVELVLMRAMSLGLLKGSIDEYDKTVAINWVQPRFLEMSQLTAMKSKLVDWQQKVDKINEFLFKESPDLASSN